jgi:hypothetical protein
LLLLDDDVRLGLLHRWLLRSSLPYRNENSKGLSCLGPCLSMASDGGDVVLNYGLGKHISPPHSPGFDAGLLLFP